ncbi:alpha/beta hydrolase [Nocardia sp. CDC159]|uniref:Alpha/beta hydrolase n=1 Tax=Nocardia pulmonis TaxID=2951408 RepID=A0A9X2IZR7_9NOCA|nr:MULTISPECIES: alpha/beta fold hydrolase [Nocardia]MCM6775241.1 alpha/beta hydrolase [Nocardia pulmonis]MCM6788025.1 alpha/beta hydrolase [Nocardia sp. CDC159]
MNDGLSAVTMGTGPPLVVLPGLGPGADLSERVPWRVARSTGTLAAGLGRTIHLIHRPVRPPVDMTIADLAGWHADALRDRFDEPVDVMGVSAGGLIALQLALDHPKTVRRLALCVAASRVDERGLRDLARMMELERAGRSAAWIGSGLIAHGPLRLVMTLALLARRRPPAPGETALVQALRSWNVTDRLGELEIPVLIVAATRDRLVPPTLVHATVVGISGARLVMLHGRGHITALYDPRLRRAVAEFLADPIR